MAAAKMSGIYEVVNSTNGRRYVGSSVDIRRRLNQHRAALRRGDHHNSYLQSAWNKHGESAFEFRVVSVCDADVLIEREQEAFREMKPEYNLSPTAGNILGFRLTEAQKRKRRGRKQSPEWVEKRAEQHRGAKRSEKTRSLISDAKIGKKMPKRSASHRDALSASLKGKKKSPEHMAALQRGRRDRVITAEENAKRSESLRRAYAEGRRSREKSPEHRTKIAETLRGRKLTEEHRAAVSAAMTGKKRGPYKKRATS